MPFSWNESLVESWNSYRTAPGTGSQANAGVRENDVASGSSTRSMNACSPSGAATVTGAATEDATQASAATSTTSGRAGRRMVLLTAGTGRHRLGGSRLRLRDERELPDDG